MRVALCTTTIHVPHVLALYRRLDPSVEFFVAGDKKTPPEAVDFISSLANCHYVDGSEYACSDLISWNTCGRRNIAFLEALKWGADVVVTVNDDDLPMNADYFYAFKDAFNAGKRSGIEISAPFPWFNPGALLVPPVRHRGFPSGMSSSFMAVPAVDTNVGVAVGLCLGDPDVDATTRIENPGLRINQTSRLLDAGVTVAPDTWTVFNSENTMLLREFLPAFFHMPGVGRSDDILASLVVQRVMRERGCRVHFGQPYVYQQRNPHRLLDDLKVEIFGMERTVEFAQWLDTVETRAVLGKDGTRDDSVLADVRGIYERMGELKWMPEIAWRAGLVFCDDCEKVL